MSSESNDRPARDPHLGRVLADTEKLVEQSRKLMARAHEVMAEEPCWDPGGASRDGDGGET